MVICDTSFLYAFFNKYDFHHKEALEFAKQYSDENLFAPVEVIQELLTTLTRKSLSEHAITVVESIFDSEAITIINSNELAFDKSWNTFKKLSPHKFSFVDCLLISLAKDSEGTILTFDKELLKAI